LKQGSGEGVVETLLENDEFYGISTNEFYLGFIESVEILYNRLLENNVAPEMARMVLPQSMLTDWVWTGNLMAFSHVFNLRSKDNAQVEARVFAECLSKVVEPLFPVSWKALTNA
jgi:thymidylate synthase (FAD)